MHFQKIGKNRSATKRYKMRQYLSTKMGLVTMLMQKYGMEHLTDF